MTRRPADSAPSAARIVLVCGLALFIIFGIRLSFSVFFAEFVLVEGWSSQAAASVFSLNMLVFAMTAPLAGPGAGPLRTAPGVWPGRLLDGGRSVAVQPGDFARRPAPGVWPGRRRGAGHHRAGTGGVGGCGLGSRGAARTGAGHRLRRHRLGLAGLCAAGDLADCTLGLARRLPGAGAGLYPCCCCP